ncbi:MAG TPA: hypothetical protein VF155_02505 [Candidatus Dormibacteraeota bacterium]
MRIRAGTSLLGLAIAAGLAGHAFGGHAAAVAPQPRPTAPFIAPPAPAPVLPGQSQGTHVLWLAINGKLRAVPP